MPYKDLEKRREAVRQSMERMKSDPGRQERDAARRKAWRESPEGRESRKKAKAKYLATPNGRAKANADIARYRATEQGKAKGQALQKAWASTSEGRERLRTNSRKYATLHRDTLRRRTREYKKSEKGRETIAARHKWRWENDLAYKIKHTLRSRLSKVLKFRKASASAIKNLGCSIESFKVYMERHPNWLPHMTWKNLGEVWEIDHIKALGLFTDLTDPVQLAEAAHYTNLQPLLTRDHQVKTANDIRLIQEAKSFKVAA